MSDLTDEATGQHDMRQKGLVNAAFTIDRPLNFVSYSDASYNYTCTAIPQSPLASSVWQVVRETLATGTFEYAGNGEFLYPATDLATVAALTFS